MENCSYSSTRNGLKNKKYIKNSKKWLKIKKIYIIIKTVMEILRRKNYEKTN